MMCVSFHAFGQLPCFVFMRTTSTVLPDILRRRENRNLIYKGQREHAIFITTWGGRQVRDPYTLFVDEKYET